MVRGKSNKECKSEERIKRKQELKKQKQEGRREDREKGKNVRKKKKKKNWRNIQISNCLIQTTNRMDKKEIGNYIYKR